MNNQRQNIQNFINTQFNVQNQGCSIQYNEDRMINELYPNPDNMTYEELIELGEKIGTVSRGLDKEKVKKIKVIKFIPNELKKKCIFHEKCSICYEDFIEEENLKILGCKHYFHNLCIDLWLEKEKKCPLCKVEIEIK